MLKRKYECKTNLVSKNLSTYCKSNHEAMTKDSVSVLLLLFFNSVNTAFPSFTVFKSKILIRFIFNYSFENNVSNLKWSELKTKSLKEKKSFEIIVFCKMSVFQNYWKTFREIRI